MPERFWLVGYGCCVWDRGLLAFVPPGSLGTYAQEEQVERFWFLTESEADAQVAELAALGCPAGKTVYHLKSS